MSANTHSTGGPTDPAKTADLRRPRLRIVSTKATTITHAGSSELLRLGAL